MTIKKALNSPTSVQSARVIRMDSVVPKPCQTNREITSALASDAVEPTERSNPPMVSEIETPIAITVTIAMERRMLMMLLGSRKFSDATPKMATSATTVSNMPHL